MAIRARFRFHHLHTGENITVTYKRNGRYDDEALKKINHEMRDWRRGEEVRMDPRVIDVIWEVNREVSGEQPIQIVCGYRAPATNTMLRRRSRGVAQFSQHTIGKAVDFYIPGVPLEAAAYRRPAPAARRRRLLSDLRLALRPSRRRQCAPLAAPDA